MVSTPAWSGKIAGLERQYMSTFIGDRSVEWIEQARQTGQPWLAFVTHSASHTPLQTPPPELTGPAPTDVSCSLSSATFRQVFQLMTDAVDRSIGQMLVELDLATDEGGEFRLRDPKETNTLIVVVNDNGSYGYTVYPPFDPSNAKQTVYETGVRSGLIIAGPMVAEPGRAVDATVAIVDLFSLLNDACGVDWKAEMPAGRIVDALPMMPYLTDPKTEEIREFNFAIYAQGTFVTGEVGPCINGTTVIDSLITSPQLCVDNGGCWAGGAESAPYPITNYCDLVSTDPTNAIVACGGTDYCFLPPDMADQCPEGSVAITPPSLVQYGVRKGPWKIVVNRLPTCLIPDDCEVTLFRLPEPVPPAQPGIEFGPDTQSWNPTVDAMPPEASAAYEELRAELIRLLVSQPRCDADGNLDGIVDGLDLAGLLGEWGSPGFWDVDLSGTVDGSDLALVLASWGPCLPPLDPSEQGIPDCLLPPPPVTVREYMFAKGFGDLTGSGVAAEPMGGRIVKGQYVFGPGQGVRVPVAGLDLEDWVIEFELTVEVPDFALGKLVDFFDLELDRGLYRTLDGGVFVFLPPFSDTSVGRLELGTPAVVRYARDAVTRTVSLAIDGVVQWVMPDPLGEGIPPGDGTITFFADDTVTGSQENFSGRVRWIRIGSASAGGG